MVKQAMALMFKREIRKFLMAGTLTGMITTVNNDTLYSFLLEFRTLTNLPRMDYQKRLLKSCTNFIIVIHFSDQFRIYFTYKIYLV